MFHDKGEIEQILAALGEQIDDANAFVPELVVCGGSALNVLGLATRVTKDVDVVAFIERSSNGAVSLAKAEPFPPALDRAAQKVARDFNLPENWLNPGPTSAVDLDLPEGLMARAETRTFGKRLTVHFLGRYDQICFKLYAAADQGPWKHYSDLLALEPAAAELEAAARWSMTHDVSETFKQTVKELLIHMGHRDVAERF